MTINNDEENITDESKPYISLFHKLIQDNLNNHDNDFTAV